MLHPTTGDRLPASLITPSLSLADLPGLLPKTVTVTGLSPALLGMTFPPGAVTDDEDADGVMAALGYSWTLHADPTRTGPFEERRSMWSPDFTAVVVDVDLTGRRNVTRSNGDAFMDLITDATRYMLDGSPLRRDGDRLFDAPLPGLTFTDLRHWITRPT